MPAESQADLPGLVPHIRDEIYGAIEAGRRARAAGEPRTANPHPARTFFWSLWLDGWREQG
jgi:ribosome modulation factor